MTLEEACNKLQKPINDIIQRECKIKVRGLEERLKALNQKQKKEALDNARLELGNELEYMVRQYFKIYVVVEEWKDSKNFMWGGGLMEVLTSDEKRQYMAFPSKDCYLEKYEQQSDIYDKELPYLSFIIKEIVLLKFRSEINLLEDWYIEKETPKPALSDVGTKIKQNNNLTQKPPSKKGNPFSTSFSDNQLEIMTKCLTEARVFSTHITKDIVENLFDGKSDFLLRSANNKLLAYFFDLLNSGKYIVNEWQAVISNNRLILAPIKDEYLNNHDLNVATHTCKEDPPKGYEIINKYIEQLKEH